jgi:hypothetical protein
MLNVVLIYHTELSRLPLVYTHGDLNGLNILTDEDGCIVDVIDWSESTWKPFGVGLYGLDTFLGRMGSDGDSSIEGHDRFRGEFFRLLSQTSRVGGTSTLRI